MADNGSDRSSGEQGEQGAQTDSDASPVSVIRYSREMGLTHADFHRLLPAAMAPHPYRVERDRVIADIADGRLEIVIGPPLVRKIAAFQLPYSVVSFTFENVTEQQQRAFKAHFDLYFQRGGG